jgi:hypothetical protein
MRVNLLLITLTWLGTYWINLREPPAWYSSPSQLTFEHQRSEIWLLDDFSECPADVHKMKR